MKDQFSLPGEKILVTGVSRSGGIGTAVVKHPVRWDKPTALLYGEKDELCEYEAVKAFAEKCNSGITVLKNGEHFFHTEEQLGFLLKWLQENLYA